MLKYRRFLVSHRKVILNTLPLGASLIVAIPPGVTPPSVFFRLFETYGKPPKAAVRQESRWRGA